MALEYIKYLQIPHAEGGRTFSGVDCFGLVTLFYKEEFGINILSATPYSGQWWKDNPTLIIRSAKASGFSRRKGISNISHGDVVVLNEEGALKHLAIYLRPGYLLHTNDHGTYCEKAIGALSQNIKAVYYYTEGINARTT